MHFGNFSWQHKNTDSNKNELTLYRKDSLVMRIFSVNDSSASVIVPEVVKQWQETKTQCLDITYNHRQHHHFHLRHCHNLKTHDRNEMLPIARSFLIAQGYKHLSVLINKWSLIIHRDLCNVTETVRRYRSNFETVWSKWVGNWIPPK